MDGPKSIGSNPELDLLKAKVSHLNAEIASISELDTSKDNLEFNEVANILENEIETLKYCQRFETERKQQLLSEDERLSKYLEEEENILKCLNLYLSTHSKPNDSNAMDERKELFFKLEILHRKLLSLIKKFSKRYFPAPPPNHHCGDLFLSKSPSDSEACEEKKSLIDILNALIIELGFESGVENSTGVLKVDDSIPQEYIEMLICADIIERFDEDSSLVKLK